MIIPLNFRTATLLPEAAIRVSLLAEPFKEVEKLEKVSLYSPSAPFSQVTSIRLLATHARL